MPHTSPICKTDIRIPLINSEIWSGEVDRKESQEGRDICILTAHSRGCAAETNTIL